MEDNKPRKVTAEDAKAFLERLAEDVVSRNMPLPMVVNLLGYFVRSFVDVAVKNGRSHEDAISDVAGFFMDGLGVNTMFKFVRPSDAPPNVH